ncbi:MAG: hypothetical protein RL487_148, partial [Actinomycetota bacterium]
DVSHLSLAELDALWEVVKRETGH